MTRKRGVNRFSALEEKVYSKGVAMPTRSPRELARAAQRGEVTLERIREIAIPIESLDVPRSTYTHGVFEEKVGHYPGRSGELLSRKRIEPQAGTESFWVGSEHQGNEHYRHYFVLYHTAVVGAQRFDGFLAFFMDVVEGKPGRLILMTLES